MNWSTVTETFPTSTSENFNLQEKWHKVLRLKCPIICENLLRNITVIRTQCFHNDDYSRL